MDNRAVQEMERIDHGGQPWSTAAKQKAASG
jgi:hypothetical protein